MITLHAGCKINLGLKITAKLANGYHKLDSIFYYLAEPYDILELELLNGTNNICVKTTCPDLDPQNNTLTRCYKIFAAALPSPYLPAINVTLHKNIPIGAGLGGGSSDAAALLTFLNQSLKVPLPPKELRAIALHIGADLSFFVNAAKCQRLQGIGAKLSHVELDLSPYTLLLVTPNLQISTALAYQEFDRLHSQKINNQAHALTRTNFSINYFCTQKLTVKQFVLNFDNDLELGVLQSHPCLKDLKELIFSLGAQVSAMSGSGSTFYGLFLKQETVAINQAVSTLKNLGHQVFVYQC